MSNLERSPDLAIACSLNQEQLELREQDVAALFAMAIQTRELPDGYALAFAAGADRAHELLDFVIAERACCPFFTFELTFAAPHEAVWLSLRGPEGIKPMLAETFPSLLGEPGTHSEPSETPAASGA
jgi:hypothetical protein